jgi:hypothetical protein
LGFLFGHYTIPSLYFKIDGVVKTLHFNAKPLSKINMAGIMLGTA